ncbi:MAG: methyltransferase [Alphaproteobacteria bacterium]|nr:methyltransferase [Alphaproteobacteria bacterium]
MSLPRLASDQISQLDCAQLGRKLKEAFLKEPTGAAGVFSGKQVRRAEVEALIGSQSIKDLTVLGIFETCPGDGLTSRFAVRHVLRKVLVTDHPKSRFRDEALIVDPLWEGPALARMMPNRRRRLSLDLGTGCGILALVLAQWSDHVIASDINPRALAMGDLNARLNSVDNISFVHSDLFEALEGQRFDQIVFNAPVGTEFRPRHMLEAGEFILETFFKAMPHHLADNGVVQLNLCFRDWPNDSFVGRMRSWMGPTKPAFGSVLLRLWKRSSGLKFLFEKALEAISAGPGALSCEAVSRGIITLMRSPVPTHTEIDVNYHQWPPQPSIGHVGEAIVAAIETGHDHSLRNLLRSLEKTSST